MASHRDEDEEEFMARVIAQQRQLEMELRKPHQPQQVQSDEELARRMQEELDAELQSLRQAQERDERIAQELLQKEEEERAQQRLLDEEAAQELAEKLEEEDARIAAKGRPLPISLDPNDYHPESPLRAEIVEALKIRGEEELCNRGGQDYVMWAYTSIMETLSEAERTDISLVPPLREALMETLVASLASKLQEQWDSRSLFAAFGPQKGRMMFAEPFDICACLIVVSTLFSESSVGVQPVVELYLKFQNSEMIPRLLSFEKMKNSEITKCFFKRLCSFLKWQEKMLVEVFLNAEEAERANSQIRMLLAEDLEVCTLFVLRLHQLLLSKRVPDDRTLKKTIDRLTDLLVCSDNTSQFDEVYCKKLLDRMTGHFYRNELESWVVQHIKEFCASNSLRKTCSLLSSHEESSILSEKFARHTQRAGQNLGCELQILLFSSTSEGGPSLQQSPTREVAPDGPSSFISVVVPLTVMTKEMETVRNRFLDFALRGPGQVQSSRQGFERKFTWLANRGTVEFTYYPRRNFECEVKSPPIVLSILHLVNSSREISGQQIIDTMGTKSSKLVRGYLKSLCQGPQESCLLRSVNSREKDFRKQVFELNEGYSQASRVVASISVEPFRSRAAIGDKAEVQETVDMRIMQVMERQQSMTFEDLCAEVQEHVKEILPHPELIVRNQVRELVEGGFLYADLVDPSRINFIVL